MGKSCIRFKKLDNVPLALIGQAIKRVPVKKFIEFYESAIAATGKKRSGTSARKSISRKGG